MKNKILIIFIFVFLLPINFKADVLYDTETSLPIDSTEICANKEYTFVQDTQMDRALVFLDSNNNFLSSKIINQAEVPVIFPSQYEQMQVIITKVIDNKIDYSQMYKMSYTIKDCGYTSEASETEESHKVIDSPLVIEHTGKKFNASYEGANLIKYQTKESKILKTLPKEGIEVTSPSIVQLEVDTTEGERYYEIQIINEEDYFIREVSTLQTREIKVNSILNFKSILFLAITLFLYMYFRVKIKNLRKKRRRQQIRKRNITKKDKKMYKKQRKEK